MGTHVDKHGDWGQRHIRTKTQVMELTWETNGYTKAHKEHGHSHGDTNTRHLPLSDGDVTTASVPG